MTERSSWHLRPGDAVAGGRRVVRLLGGGKRTEVVLARGPGSDELTVVKLLRPDGGDGAARALVAEGELLGALEHPLFPRLVELCRPDGGPVAVVIEYIEGRRLSTALRRSGPLTPGAAAELAIALADGLAALHAEGSVHLDVKPANTILSTRPRLVDLGVARSLPAAARVRGKVGSHRFQSPEQHDPGGFGGLTPAADVWGVGVTVATAVRGVSPFGPLLDGRGERRRLVPGDVAGLQLPDELPATLVGLIRHAMAWDPAERPTAHELAAMARSLGSGR